MSLMAFELTNITVQRKGGGGRWGGTNPSNFKHSQLIKKTNKKPKWTLNSNKCFFTVLKRSSSGDFSGGPVIRDLPCSAKDVVHSLVRELPQASEQLGSPRAATKNPASGKEDPVCCNWDATTHPNLKPHTAKWILKKKKKRSTILNCSMCIPGWNK